MKILFLGLFLAIWPLFYCLKSEQWLSLVILCIPFDNILKVATPIGFVSIFDIVLLTAGLSILTKAWWSRTDYLEFSDLTGLYGVLGALFVVSGILSLGIAHFPSDAFRALITRIQHVGFFFLCLGTFTTIGRLRGALRILVVAAVGASIIVIGQGFGVFVIDPTTVSAKGRVVAGVQLPFARSSGLFDIYGRFGAFSALGFAAAVVSSIHPTLLRVRRSVAILAAGIIGLAVFVTQSRSTWVAYLVLIAVLTVVWIGYSYRSNPTRLVLLTTLGGGFVLTSLAILGPLLISVKPSTFLVRLEQLRVALFIFGQNPLFGVGKGAFLHINMELYGQGHVLHNIYANTLVQSGLVGFVPFFLLHLLPVMQLVRYLLQPLCNELQAAFLITFLAGYAAILVELQFSSGLAYSSFWLAIGTAAAAYFALMGQKPIRWLRDSAVASERPQVEE